MFWLLLLALVIGAGVLLWWWHRREPLDAVAGDAPTDVHVVTKSRALRMRITARVRHRRRDRARAHGLVLRRRRAMRSPGSNRQRVVRPADAALLGVQQLSAAVDQVLSTAGGVVAATGGDPRRFVAVLGPDIDASPALAGIALVEARAGDRPGGHGGRRHDVARRAGRRPRSQPTSPQP